MARACSKCGGPGPFHKDVRVEDGLQSRCVDCQGDAAKEWDAAHPEQASARRARNRDTARDSARTLAWQRANPERWKAIRLRTWYKRRYNTTPEEIERMRIAQGNRCAICGEEPAPGESLHIDHDHETNKVRGLLCGPCNRGLGCLRDAARLCIKAAEYLLFHAGKLKEIEA